MDRRNHLALLAALVLAAACLPPEETQPDGGVATDASEPPIPDVPLSGKVNGKPFVLKSALALPWHADGNRTLWLLDRVEDCQPAAQPWDQMRVTANVLWQQDAETHFNSLNEAIFLNVTDAGSETRKVGLGRAEVLAASTGQGLDAGSPPVGVVLLRIGDPAGPDFVEGRVEALVCPQ